LPVRRAWSDPVESLHREVSRLFDDFFRGFDLAWDESPADRWLSFSPRLDVVEDEDKITVSAELPGLEEKEIEVSLSPDALTISGEKKQEQESRGLGYYRAERSYGSFQRVIPLPCEIDEDKVEAEFRRGVLKVTLPKSPAARAGTRRVAIREVA